MKNEKQRQNKKILQDLLNNKFMSGDILQKYENQKEIQYIKTEASLVNDKNYNVFTPKNENEEK